MHPDIFISFINSNFSLKTSIHYSRGYKPEKDGGTVDKKLKIIITEHIYENSVKYFFWFYALLQVSRQALFL